VDETWQALETLGLLGGPTWFRLGDSDLGLHLERTRRLHAGQALSRITVDFCNALGIGPRVLPMSDDMVQTWVYTNDEELPFQEYFVRRQCHPQVTGFRFQGAELAQPAPGVLEALTTADYVVICPSNPWVSIDPILIVKGIRPAVENKLVIAVSPIIRGEAVKGPVAKMYSELGIEPSALAVARHYGGLLSGFVLDNQDFAQSEVITTLGIRVLSTDILMKTVKDRLRLAEEVLAFCHKLSKEDK
jgi:LPPG:FO 2-phospho-L-lactate transferase